MIIRPTSRCEMATIHYRVAVVWACDAADCDVKTNNQKSLSNPGLIGPVLIDPVQILGGAVMDQLTDDDDLKAARDPKATLDFIGDGELMRNPASDPSACRGLVRFSEEVFARGSPVCLVCDEVWVSMAVPPPAAFAFVRPASYRDNSEPITEIVSGICRTCCGHSDLYARAIARYRELWPSLRAVAIHDAPAGVQ
jgi:hypothetical protein